MQFLFLSTLGSNFLTCTYLRLVADLKAKITSEDKKTACNFPETQAKQRGQTKVYEVLK